MTKPAEPSTPSGPSATTMKATDHELQKYDNFTRYGQVTMHALTQEPPARSRVKLGAELNSRFRVMAVDRKRL
jgi:hypothetical protein